MPYIISTWSLWLLSFHLYLMFDCSSLIIYKLNLYGVKWILCCQNYLKICITIIETYRRQPFCKRPADVFFRSPQQNAFCCGKISSRSRHLRAAGTIRWVFPRDGLKPLFRFWGFRFLGFKVLTRFLEGF